MAFVLNYTTKVPVNRTLAEIQGMLAEHGARSIAMEYDAARKPAGLAFQIDTAMGENAVFTLPVDVSAVQRLLTAQRREHGARVDARPEQAERVAWRIIKDWLAAQLTLIEAGMATLDQVMLPYLRWDGDSTLYQAAVSAREHLELARSASWAERPVAPRETQ